MQLDDYLSAGLGGLVVFFIAVMIPLTFTVWNIINCFKNSKNNRIAAGFLTIGIGGIMYLMLMAFFNINGEWYEPIYPDQLHTPISGEQFWIVLFVLFFGFIGLFTLIMGDPKKQPPLVTVFATAFVIIMNIASAVFAIQLLKNFFFVFDLLFYVYHFNILLISADAVRRSLKEQAEYLSSREEDFGHNKNLFWLFMKVKKASQYSLPIVMALFLIVAALEILAVLAGQGLDAPIKLFTDTADWTFSRQIPPPPLEYEGHYLCTVAAGGHRKVVKPIRYGRRRGAIIIVNRQLCIANAFEESIAERFPRFHRWIRHVYDTYGYPLSNIITNERRADITYIVMKPLEWIFLVYLYLTDARPEIRINRQYKL